MIYVNKIRWFHDMSIHFLDYGCLLFHVQPGHTRSGFRFQHLISSMPSMLPCQPVLAVFGCGGMQQVHTNAITCHNQQTSTDYQSCKISEGIGNPSVAIAYPMNSHDISWYPMGRWGRWAFPMAWTNQTHPLKLSWTPEHDCGNHGLRWGEGWWGKMRSFKFRDEIIKWYRLVWGYRPNYSISYHNHRKNMEKWWQLWWQPTGIWMNLGYTLFKQTHIYCLILRIILVLEDHIGTDWTCILAKPSIGSFCVHDSQLPNCHAAKTCSASHGLVEAASILDNHCTTFQYFPVTDFPASLQLPAKGGKSWFNATTGKELQEIQSFSFSWSRSGFVFACQDWKWTIGQPQIAASLHLFHSEHGKAVHYSQCTWTKQFYPAQELCFGGWLACLSMSFVGTLMTPFGGVILRLHCGKKEEHVTASPTWQHTILLRHPGIFPYFNTQIIKNQWNHSCMHCPFAPLSPAQQWVVPTRIFVLTEWCCHDMICNSMRRHQLPGTKRSPHGTKMRAGLKMGYISAPYGIPQKDLL